MDKPEADAAGKPRGEALAPEELGALLRLFTSLGLTVALGIAGALALGIYLDGKVAALGLAPRGAAAAALLLAGLALSVYWAYLSIARHLDKFPPRRAERPGAGEKEEENDAGT